MTKSWPEYLLGFAEHAATKSKDQTQVGVCIVGPQKNVLLTAYNGPPIGVQDRPERRERPTKYLFTAHAEENAVAFAARRGIQLEGCTAYVTHHPCARCARSLIQAGVTKVVVGGGTTSMPPEEFEAAAVMFAEAAVAVEQGP